MGEVDTTVRSDVKNADPTVDSLNDSTDGVRVEKHFDPETGKADVYLIQPNENIGDGKTLEQRGHVFSNPMTDEVGETWTVVADGKKIHLDQDLFSYHEVAGEASPSNNDLTQESSSGASTDTFSDFNPKSDSESELGAFSDATAEQNNNDSQTTKSDSSNGTGSDPALGAFGDSTSGQSSENGPANVSDSNATSGSDSTPAGGSDSSAGTGADSSATAGSDSSEGTGSGF